MHWIAPSEKDNNTAALEKRLWDAADQFRAVDQGPNTPAGQVVNAQGCSIDQIVSCDAAWKSHGHDVEAVARVSAQFYQAGLLTREQRQDMITRAAESECGKPNRPN